MQAANPARFAETMSEIRFMCISQVLGTDMKKHFDISSRFQVSPLWFCNSYDTATFQEVCFLLTWSLPSICHNSSLPHTMCLQTLGSISDSMPEIEQVSKGPAIASSQLLLGS